MSKLSSNQVSDTFEGPEAEDSRSTAVFDDRGRTVPWVTRTLYRLYETEAQKVLDKAGISAAHWFYLRVLAERGEMNQLELSKRVGIASTTAVPALDSMEKRKLVQRTRDPMDRRKYYVSLQDEGRRVVDALLPELTAMIVASLDGISAEDLQVFWKVMHQIETNLTLMSQGDAAID